MKIPTNKQKKMRFVGANVTARVADVPADRDISALKRKAYGDGTRGVGVAEIDKLTNEESEGEAH